MKRSHKNNPKKKQVPAPRAAKNREKEPFFVGGSRISSKKRVESNEGNTLWIAQIPGLQEVDVEHKGLDGVLRGEGGKSKVDF